MFLATGFAAAQSLESKSFSELKLRVETTSSGTANHQLPPAVVWLSPMPGTSALPFVPTGHYTLLQKNRTFIPHLQVIPVGSVVNFPNADPFFHNVFSLYEGKRFDLGLYEAGSSKSVTFSREGASYIFCNIHPDMSAVVLALSTPLYATASINGSIAIHSIPAGDYRLHIWMEGVPQVTLESLSRPVRFSANALDLGTINVPLGRVGNMQHKNKFGESYDTNSPSAY